MSIRLEVGNYYRTRDGRKVGPMKCGFSESLMVADGWSHKWFTCSGRRSFDFETDADLVAQWVESTMENKEYKPWGDLTDLEKGALLLAHHEGKVIEVFDLNDEWNHLHFPTWQQDVKYRIEPEPVVETVNIYGGVWPSDLDWCFGTGDGAECTHKITFQVIGGKPDCNSIKMEEL